MFTPDMQTPKRAFQSAVRPGEARAVEIQVEGRSTDTVSDVSHDGTLLIH